MAKHGLPRNCLPDAVVLLRTASRYVEKVGSEPFTSIAAVASVFEAMDRPHTASTTWAQLSVALRTWMSESLGNHADAYIWLRAYHSTFFAQKTAKHGLHRFFTLYNQKWLRHMAQQLKEEHAGRAGFKPAAKPVKQDRQAIDRTPRATVSLADTHVPIRKAKNFWED